MRRALAGTTITLLLLAGCSDDDDTGRGNPSPSTSLSASQGTAAGAAFAREMLEIDSAHLYPVGGTPVTQAAVSQAIAKLKALTPPAEQRATTDELLRSLETAAATADATARAAAVREAQKDLRKIVEIAQYG